MGIYSFSPFGYDGSIVSVEVDLRKGIPATDIVGLADSAVKESRERMQAAIRNAGFTYPQERILISLSPADIRKEGAGFDLPLALAVLVANHDICKENPTSVLVMGELELSGNVRKVKGTYGALTTARSYGIEYAIVPKGSEIPVGIKVREIESLEQALIAYNNLDNETYFKMKTEEDVITDFSTADNLIFDDSIPNMLDGIKGHGGLKYAMAVAIAGRHNLLTYGAPGCGKTMILQQAPLLMPRLTFKESLSVSRIWSLAGLHKEDEAYTTERPFRIPHQTASIEGMCGGGPTCRPGEISLSHNGVLFLDETAEFRSSVLQMLRVPLETNKITLARAGRSTVFPAKFQLFMATNPCPCGNYGSKTKICLCSTKSIEQYWKKFSAPLLDTVAIRFDAVNAEGVDKDYTLAELRELIATAWKAQYKRQCMRNQDLTPNDCIEFIKLTDGAQKVLDKATLKYELSPREIRNILKLSRTLTDMHCPDDDTVGAITMENALRLHGKLELAF